VDSQFNRDYFSKLYYHKTDDMYIYDKLLFTSNGSNNKKK